MPTLLTIYFVVTQYSQNFVAEQSISYLDVQNNWLGELFLSQQYIEWFNRFMDFAFWGIAAFVVLIGVWAFGAARVSVKNHYTQEEFQNFNENKLKWHENYFIIVLLKLIFVIVIVYSVFAIIGKHIPQLSAQISSTLAYPEVQKYSAVLVAGLAIFIYQYLIVLSVKLFKHLNAQ